MTLVVAVAELSAVLGSNVVELTVAVSRIEPEAAVTFTQRAPGVVRISGRQRKSLILLEIKY